MRYNGFIEVDVDTFIDWYSDKSNITHDFMYRDEVFCGKGVWALSRNGQTTPEDYIRKYWTGFMIPHQIGE